MYMVDGEIDHIHGLPLGIKDSLAQLSIKYKCELQVCHV